MNDTQENKYTMYLVVADHLQDHAADYADHPKIEPSRLVLVDKISKIEEADGYATEDITGVAADKKDERKDLEDICFKVGSAMASYARDNNDDKLQEKTDFSLSDFRKMRDGDLNVKAGHLKRLADPIIVDLADYRLLPAHLTALNDEREEYFEAIPETRDAEIDKSMAGKNVDRLMSETDTLLEKIDGYVDSYRFDNPEVWGTYQMAREIQDTGSGGGGGDDEATVISGTVAPSSSVNEAITYDASASLSLHNPGAVSLDFDLLLEDGTPAGSTITVAPGNTVSITMSDWGAGGASIEIINNDGFTEGQYEITIN